MTDSAPSADIATDSSAESRTGTATGSSALAPLHRPEPLWAQVQSALRELIIKRVYEPGEHLGESEVARRLQVSRQPVREALQALHVGGWVDLRAGRGAFVRTPTNIDVNEVFDVRGALEEEAARLATSRITDEGLETLRHICQEGRRALAAADVHAVVAANARFHRTVSQSAGNRVLTDVLDSLDQRVRWYFTPLARGRGEDSWNEHEEIIEALAAGDGARAGALMRLHTERTRSAHNLDDSER